MNEDTEHKLAIPALTEEQQEEWRKVGAELAKAWAGMIDGLKTATEEFHRYLEEYQKLQADRLQHETKANKGIFTIVPPDSE